jgi:hypothetical protein
VLMKGRVLCVRPEVLSHLLVKAKKTTQENHNCSYTQWHLIAKNFLA